jgi:SAM-dependent methyltransferase
MRPSIKHFVKICSETLPILEPIYEFGSMQPVGQEGFADLRPYFAEKEYVGCDLGPGTGVDRVMDLQDTGLPPESVGTTLCCDTLEHVEYPRKALSEMHRILKPGGTCIITSVMNYRIHAAPHDYWRFTPEGFRSLLSSFPSVYVDWNGSRENPHTVVGVGMKMSYPFERLFSRRDEWRRVPDTRWYDGPLTTVVQLKKRWIG